MLWFYQRGLEDFKIETHHDTATNEYVIITRSPTAGGTVEYFKDVFSFRARLEALEQKLLAEQWQQLGPPVPLKDGWKIT